MHPRRLTLAAGAALLMLVTACTSDPEDTEAEPSPSASESTPAGSAEPTQEPSGQDSGQPSDEPTADPEAKRTRPPNPVSVPALFERRMTGGDLRLGEPVAVTDAYRKYSVSYRSNGLRVSGVLYVPLGRGPFPAAVLAHGYIDPAIYTNGQGMMREQDYLARAGFVVLHTDYRNHGFSDDDPSAERRMRLGYTVDVVNAVKALRRADLPVDDERVGLVGRSMGGGVVQNVLTTKPGLVDAGVVYASVSSRTADNFNRWIRDDPGRSALSDHILSTYGEPRENPRFWREVSPRAYFDRISEPVLIHHGTADESCPVIWSRDTHRLMREAGVDAELRIYPGEPHAFINGWPLSMQRTVAFLREHL